MSLAPAEPPKPSRLLVVLAYVGFVSLGLPDAVLGVAWPSVRNAFDLHQSALGVALVGSSTGYFLSSFLSGRLVRALGVGTLLAVSSGMVAVAAIGYGLAPVWVLFVACAALHGLGSGAIDAGLNGYAASHLSARHMNWLHACYCLGAMLGPLLMTRTLSLGASYTAGYVVVGGVMAVLAVLSTATRRRWDGPAAPDEGGHAPGMWSALGHPTVWLQIVVFFLYTGLEWTVGQWSFTILTESRGVARDPAGVWAGAYWGSLGVGRVLFGFVIGRFGIDRLLRYSTAAALAGALLFAAAPSTGFDFAGLVLIGLGLAPVYPCLMTRTPQRLGKALAAHAVGFQVGAAMIGAAAVPATLGLVAQGYGLETVAAGAAALAAVLWLLHEVLLLRTRPVNSGSVTPDRIS